MEKFQFLTPSNDLRVAIFGKNLEDLFENAALAMMTYLYPKEVEIDAYETSKKIKITAATTEELFFDWLNELLHVSDEKNVCYNHFIFKKLRNDELYIKAHGRRVKAKNNIKKILSKDIRIEKNEEGYNTMIVFDI